MNSFFDYYNENGFYNESVMDVLNKFLLGPGEPKIQQLVKQLKERPELQGSIVGTVYISGPMSGYPNANYPAFYRAEAALRAIGYNKEQIKNPATIKHKKYSNWMDFMRADLAGLMQTNGIVLLNNWEKSYGAQVEVDLANAFNKTPYHKFHVMTLQEAVGVSDKELADIVGEEITSIKDKNVEISNLSPATA